MAKLTNPVLSHFKFSLQLDSCIHLECSLSTSRVAGPELGAEGEQARHLVEQTHWTAGQ